MRVTTTAAPAWGVAERWLVSSQPVFEAGAFGSDPELGSVAGVAVLSDGRVVVADAFARAVHVFSLGGERLTTFGREGDGPGEYRRIGSVQIADGDTILVFDLSQARVSKLAPDGRLLGDLSVRPDDMPGIGSAVQVGDGRLVLTGAVLAGPGPPGFEDLRYPVVLFDPRTGEHRTILRPVGLQLYRSAEGFIQQVPIARSRSTLVADRIYIGNGESWRIDVYDFDGTHLESWRRAAVDLVIDESTFRDLTERLIAELPDENTRRLWRRVYAEQPAPPTAPAYDKLLGGRGHVWARIYNLPLSGGTEQWAVFDERGRFLGEVVLPPRFELLEILPDRVLGIHRDEYDVESVRGYRLERRVELRPRRPAPSGIGRRVGSVGITIQRNQDP